VIYDVKCINGHAMVHLRNVINYEKVLFMILRS